MDSQKDIPPRRVEAYWAALLMLSGFAVGQTAMDAPYAALALFCMLIGCILLKCEVAIGNFKEGFDIARNLYGGSRGY